MIDPARGRVVDRPRLCTVVLHDGTQGHTLQTLQLGGAVRDRTEAFRGRFDAGAQRAGVALGSG